MIPTQGVPSFDELLTVDELAARFKLTRWTVYNLTRQRNRKQGAIPYLKLGRELRFRHSAVEAWIRAQEVSQ
jgi:excisionase family DNA binding protein